MASSPDDVSEAVAANIVRLLRTRWNVTSVSSDDSDAVETEISLLTEAICYYADTKSYEPKPYVTATGPLKTWLDAAVMIDGGNVARASLNKIMEKYHGTEASRFHARKGCEETSYGSEG